MDPLAYHKELKGKIEVISRAKVESRDDLSLAYTPGVAQPCLEIAKDVSKVYDYTRKGNMVAVITDGSAVLGLGDIGPEASLPVMEGKCLLFKEFADVDAFPIAIRTQDVEEFVRTVQLIAPMFGGINLEDISAPRCFSIEQRLRASLNIPVFHDDQHGTAIVVLAGLRNALKIVKKEIQELRVVIVGVGAAGVATANLLLSAGVRDIRLCDSKGLICNKREDLNAVKEELLEKLSKQDMCGTMETAFIDADVVVAVSGKSDTISEDMIRSMAENPIVFSLGNPNPEIMPDVAKAAGAAVVATGRSDFPNQINNVLAFPGIFRGLFDKQIPQVTEEMKVAVAYALADYVTEVSADNIIPPALDKGVSSVVAKAVIDAA